MNPMMGLLVLEPTEKGARGVRPCLLTQLGLVLFEELEIASLLLLLYGFGTKSFQSRVELSAQVRD